MPGTLDIKDLELNALLEVTQAINNNLSENDLYRIYKFTLLGDLQVKRMALFVADTDWKCRVSFGSKHEWEGVILDEKFRNITFSSLLTHETSHYGDFDKVIPIFHKKQLLAIVFLSGILDEKHSDSSTFLQALTNIILVAIENKKLARRELAQEAYRKELEIAKRVQNFLFPKTLPNTDRLKIEAFYLPHHDVGGDYYDYLVIDENRFLVCVADVSGKGVPAALLMSNFQASLRTLIRKTHDPKEIVSELNHIIFESGNGENFITAFFGLYDYQACTFEFINCGHNTQYLVCESGIEEMDDGTTILGAFPVLPFLTTVKIENIKKFLFFGYTDGLTEVFDPEGEQFGEARVKAVLEERFPSDMELLKNRLKEEMDQFRKGETYKDDITILACFVNNV
jgi:phosphoserine phosphatase RsbU/P